MYLTLGIVFNGLQGQYPDLAYSPVHLVAVKTVFAPFGASSPSMITIQEN